MTTPIKSLVVGTAGHIDHGKTALIRALTGIDADRLPEEKRRGITIDLGFAFLDAASPDGCPLRISFVDVPGHSLFIHNMLAGAGCIAAVMLVVSAQEGVKPQTVEHLAICGLLGISVGVTAITKSDLVDPSRLAQVQMEVRELLRGTFLDAGRSEIITVSARTGENLAQLSQTLVRLAENWHDDRYGTLARLPIDRAFVMKGFGTVVTGTLLSGTLQVGQSLVIEGGGRPARVRGIQNHGVAESDARAGSRVALNLGGIEVSEVSRGQMLVVPETLTAVDTIDCEACLLAGSSVLRHGSVVYLHAFTANTLATALLYGGGRLEAGTTRLLRLKLQAPIVLVPGDPFVLRQVSPAATIGGGRVLDAHPLPRLRKPQVMTWLDTLLSASPEGRLLSRIARRGTDGLSMRRLVAETGLAPDAVDRLCRPLVTGHRLVQLAGEIFLAAQALDEACDAITGLLQKFPGGLKRSELMSRTSLRQGILDVSLERLVREHRLRVHGESIDLVVVGGSSPTGEDPNVVAILAIYQKAGLSAPLISEVAAMLGRKESEVRSYVTKLLRQKLLVRMGSDDLFMHHEALARLRTVISELRGQSLEIARFKQITGLSRKYTIPLLEYLDRERITRKLGDHRLVL